MTWETSHRLRGQAAKRGALEKLFSLNSLSSYIHKLARRSSKGGDEKKGTIEIWTAASKTRSLKGLPIRAGSQVLWVLSGVVRPDFHPCLERNGYLKYAAECLAHNIASLTSVLQGIRRF